MNPKSLSWIAFAGVIVGFGLSITLTLTSGHYTALERTALSRQAEFKQLGLDLANSSDRLTKEARRYVIYGEKAHFDNYWREVNETKTGERVVARLKELDAPADELALIEQGKALSDKLIATEEAAMAAVAGGDLTTAQKLMYGPEDDAEVAKIMAPLGKFQEIMNARAEQEAQSAIDTAELMQHLNLAVQIVVALLVLALVGFVFIRRAVTPLGHLTATLAETMAGRMESAVPHVNRRDEIGILAKSILELRSSLTRQSELEAEQRAEQARKEQRQGVVEGHIRSFDETIAGSLQLLASASTEMRSTSESMSATAEEAARQATTVATAAELASTNVQTVASAAEELSSSISEISRQVGESSRISRQAVDEADRTDEFGEKPRRSRPKDRRRRSPDQRHRQPDQFAGPQRNHRSGARG